MITPQELRIGNRLRPLRILDPENTPICGYSICAGHLAYSIERLNYDWEGIIVSKDVLENCGFKNYPSGSLDRWRLNRFYLECSWYAKETFIFRWENMDHTGAAPTTKIKYLHQLQNLYFALTGTELVIKL